jgi:hypothetical protein
LQLKVIDDLWKLGLDRVSTDWLVDKLAESATQGADVVPTLEVAGRQT